MGTDLAALRSVIEAAFEAENVPGGVVAVARGTDPPACLAVGVDSAGRPLAEDSLVPVASITKLATALAILRLADTGTLSIDDPLARHLPDAVAARDGVTVRALLCHTSGLPNDLPSGTVPYAPGLDWPALAQASLRLPLHAPPRQRVIYSNVGIGLLALIVERLAGQPFPVVLQSLVLGPLAVEGYLGTEPPRVPARIVLGAASADPALESFNSAFWRSVGFPWGGLVTTAAGALALARAFAGVPAGFLRPATLAEATRDQTVGLAGGLGIFGEWSACPWGLGAELRGEKMPHWTPTSANPRSFGHLGASGCIAWSDPAAGISWAILGTRLCIDGWLKRAGPTIGAALLA